MALDTLTVVLIDSLRTRMAVIYENDHVPFRRRTVHVRLTPEQLAVLAPRPVGTESGQVVYEELGAVWLEEHA